MITSVSKLFAPDHYHFDMRGATSTLIELPCLLGNLEPGRKLSSLLLCQYYCVINEVMHLSTFREHVTSAIGKQTLSQDEFYSQLGVNVSVTIDNCGDYLRV